VDRIYEFLTGPALWAAFTIFFIGLVVRFACLLTISGQETGILRYENLKNVLRSLARWLVGPWLARFRTQPALAVASFLFYLFLLGVPLTLRAHNTLLEEAFSISFASLRESVSDAFAMVFVASALTLIAARIPSREVRSRSSPWDYCVPVLAIAVFIAGFLAFHQIGPYGPILILHIFFAEKLLIVIPLSRSWRFTPSSAGGNAAPEKFEGQKAL